MLLNLASTIPTNGRTRRNQFGEIVRGFIGLMSCIAGASLFMVFGGVEAIRFIAPFIRTWPELLQFVPVAIILCASVATGWVVAFFAIVMPFKLFE